MLCKSRALKNFTRRGRHSTEKFTRRGRHVVKVSSAEPVDTTYLRVRPSFREKSSLGVFDLFCSQVEREVRPTFCRHDASKRVSLCPGGVGFACVAVRSCGGISDTSRRSSMCSRLSGVSGVSAPVKAKRVVIPMDVDPRSLIVRSLPRRCVGCCYRRELNPDYGCKHCKAKHDRKMARVRGPREHPVPPDNARQAGIAARMCAEYLHMQAFGPVESHTVKVWVLWEDVDVLVFDARELVLETAYCNSFRCPCGPTSIASQAVFMESYDPSSAQWMFVDASTSGARPPMSSQSSVPPLAAVARVDPRIIMDTGCGDSIVSVDFARQAGLVTHSVPRWRGKCFQGVGGVSNCVTKARVAIEEFREECDYWVSGSSPALSSVGRRCIDHGFSFVWPARERPYFVTPWGTVVPLIVDDYIPYMYPGHPDCAPVPLSPEHLCIAAPAGASVRNAPHWSGSDSSVMEHSDGHHRTRRPDPPPFPPGPPPSSVDACPEPLGVSSPAEVSQSAPVGDDGKSSCKSARSSVTTSYDLRSPGELEPMPGPRSRDMSGTCPPRSQSSSSSRVVPPPVVVSVDDVDGYSASRLAQSSGDVVSPIPMNEALEQRGVCDWRASPLPGPSAPAAGDTSRASLKQGSRDAKLRCRLVDLPLASSVSIAQATSAREGPVFQDSIDGEVCAPSLAVKLAVSSDAVCRHVLLVEGSVRSSDVIAAPAPRRDLKLEAHELEHLRTHKPANPHCVSCMRGKLRHVPHRAGSFARPVARWGGRDHV